MLTILIIADNEETRSYQKRMSDLYFISILLLISNYSRNTCRRSEFIDKYYEHATLFIV